MIKIAGVAELVDAPDSKSGFFGSASSILALGTIKVTAILFFFMTYKLISINLDLPHESNIISL